MPSIIDSIRSIVAEIGGEDAEAIISDIDQFIAATTKEKVCTVHNHDFSISREVFTELTDRLSLPHGLNVWGIWFDHTDPNFEAKYLNGDVLDTSQLMFSSEKQVNHIIVTMPTRTETGHGREIEVRTHIDLGLFEYGQDDLASVFGSILAGAEAVIMHEFFECATFDGKPVVKAHRDGTWNHAHQLDTSLQLDLYRGDVHRSKKAMAFINSQTEPVSEDTHETIPS